jgi:hypothetical protein
MLFVKLPALIRYHTALHVQTAILHLVLFLQGHDASPIALLKLPQNINPDKKQLQIDHKVKQT